MKRPGFVVTGCSRSGSTYAARLLSALGFPCGHERIFNIYRVREAVCPAELFSAAEPGCGDSSFLAAPFLAELPPGSVVLHQLRHPLAVIRSHMGIRFFADPYQPSIYLADNHPDFVEVVRRHCPAVFEEESELGRCTGYWVHWNRLVQRAEGLPGLRYLRYRVEDLDRRLLQTIGELLGRAPSAAAAEEALAGVSRSTNARPRDESISWQALPRGCARAALAELAGEYGYSLPAGARA